MLKNISKIIPILILLGFLAYKYIYQAPKYQDGEDIPNFSASLLDGKDFELSELRGSYVLLDFWGSWCGPCRQDNPNIVKLYNEFNGKAFKAADGFEIVSVAIETKKERCIAAIDKDGLIWPYHIVLLDRFNSEIAKSFGVREIPTKYLISTSGEIISVNGSYTELRESLLSQLN